MTRRGVGCAGGTGYLVGSGDEVGDAHHGGVLPPVQLGHAPLPVRRALPAVRADRSLLPPPYHDDPRISEVVPRTFRSPVPGSSFRGSRPGPVPAHHPGPLKSIFAKTSARNRRTLLARATGRLGTPHGVVPVLPAVALG